MDEGGSEIYPPDSDLYKPTGNFKTDAEKLAKVVKPLAENNKRIEKEEAETRRLNNEKLEVIKRSIVEATNGLPERTVMPLDEGDYLVVAKLNDRLRLARTGNPDVRMTGYHADFQAMSAFEVVTLTNREGDNRSPDTIRVFDIDKLQKGHISRYWGDAERVHLDQRDHEGSWGSTFGVSEITQKAPLTSMLPDLLKHTQSVSSNV